jgi:hypothetical protein
MFISERPFGAVAAALAVALLVVCLDRACGSQAPATDAGPTAEAPSAACAGHTAGVSSAPDRDLSLSCRLPPA